jgi:hypothetical protein
MEEILDEVHVGFNMQSCDLPFIISITPVLGNFRHTPLSVSKKQKPPFRGGSYPGLLVALTSLFPSPAQYPRASSAMSTSSARRPVILSTDGSICTNFGPSASTPLPPPPSFWPDWLTSALMHCWSTFLITTKESLRKGCQPTRVENYRLITV